ncbi:FAD-dependent monooxygenase [bacterium endosymbiont of Pedicinus badii]|uniref:FAD-dependent monooxygenase n=1 Tax=bacterium endosymbiont of Pedicinus badii TaxID=1719126 RepID=UPI0009B959BB|nr:FAD-dependent monooxygenase [bacterium endosymbiont of Pedicinus badii]OQM34012.1 hypothetical protein AOQ89_01470 [bacterium endosymbiont of Pedicinus badii]
MKIAVIGDSIISYIFSIGIRKFSKKKAKIFLLIRKNKEKDESKTIAISYKSYKRLVSLKIWNHIKKYSFPIKKIVFSYQNSVSFSYSHPDCIKIGYSINLKKFKNKLLKITKKCSNIKIIDFSNISKIKEKKNNIIFLKNKKKIKIDLVVYTEKNFFFDESLLEIQKKKYFNKAYTFEVYVKNPNYYTSYEHFGDFGLMTLIPKKKFLYSLIWFKSIKYEKKNFSKKKNFLKIKKYTKPILGKILRIKKNRCYTLNMHFTKNVFYNNSIFIGNAAQIFHPICAQGFNLNLRDTYCIIKIISKIIKKNRSIKYIDLYQYTKYRNQERKKIINFVEILEKFFLSKSNSFIFLKKTVFLLIRKIKFLQKTFIKRIMYFLLK